MKINYWAIAGMVFAMLLIVSNSPADALVYEGFETGVSKDYTADVTIIGENPTVTGFLTSDAWINTGGVAASVDFYTRTAGLSYLNLITTDGSVEHFRTSTSAGSYKAVDRQFNYAYDDNKDDEVWFSMLFNFSSGSETDVYLCEEDDGIGGVSDGNFDTSLSVADTGAATLDLAGKYAVDIDLGTLTAGTTYLLVVKAADRTVQGDGEPSIRYDDITAWLNPASVTSLGTATGTGYGIFRELDGEGDTGVVDEFGSLEIGGIVGTNESFKVDEVRLGHTQGDVTPIPEPATLTLLGLGGLGLLIRRRRRS